MCNRFSCLSAFLIVFLFPWTGTAQDRNTPFLTAVSGGYTYAASSHFPILVANASLPVSPSVHFNGWRTSLGVGLFRNLGIAADFSGLYGSRNSSVTLCAVRSCATGIDHESANLYTFLFGPRFAITFKRFTPFAEALFGAALLWDKGTFTPLNPLSSPSQLKGSFADTFGAGVAYQLTHQLDWLVQADLLQTRLGYTSLPTAPFLSSDLENTVQLSTGVSFRFCASKNCFPSKQK
jgi:hypothetical protein